MAAEQKLDDGFLEGVPRIRILGNPKTKGYYSQMPKYSGPCITCTGSRS